MRKKILGGLVALALALAPVAGANAAPYPPNESEDLHGSLSALTGAPGDTITYTAPVDTYEASEAVTSTVTGPGGTEIPLVSGATPANADGSHQFAFVIPADAKNGDQYHVLVLRANGTIWEDFVVTAVVEGVDSGNPPGNGSGSGDGSGSGAGAGGGSGSAGGSGSGSGGLAMTGSDIAITGVATGAVLLFVGGLVLLLVRRRRPRAHAAA